MHGCLERLQSPVANPASWSPSGHAPKTLQGQAVAHQVAGSVQFTGDEGQSVSVNELVGMTQRVKVMEAKLDLLIEAIGLNHQKENGVCREDCWSCRVNDTIKCIETARRLM